MSHPLLSRRIHAACGNPPARAEDRKEWAGPFVIVSFDTTCSMRLKRGGSSPGVGTDGSRSLILISKRAPLTRISKSMFFDFTKLFRPVMSLRHTHGLSFIFRYS